MGTKNDPGLHDCYEKAEPDEPMFILLARDIHAPLLVRIWAQLRDAAGKDPVKVLEALACASQMETWRKENRDG